MEKSLINRPLYIDKISKFIKKDLVKVIIGQRRVGKSYILLQIIDILKKSYDVAEKEIIYINKEDLKWNHIKNYKDLYNEINGFKHIFIDEIQDIIEWEKAIRSLQSTGGYDIYITGSNSNLLSSELSTFLGGRYVSFQIYPLNYQEFLTFHCLKPGEESFEKFIKYGGLPYLKNLPLEDEVIYQYLSDIVDTILLRDVISRNNIRNTDFFKKLIVYLSKETGHLFSSKKVSDYLKSQNIKIAPNTIIEYIEASKSACFLNNVSRYDLKGKKIFELLQKYYFTDVGIKNTLIGGYAKIYISGILENVVYNDLVSKGWEVFVGVLGEKEVDFVCKKGEEIIYLQVAYLLESEATKQREFAPLLEIHDSWKKYVLTMDKGASGYIDGVKWMNIIDFLMDLK